MRAAFFRLIRSYFYQDGFLEVDTPIRQPVYIPESNIVPIASEEQYLQTSPELCMKRLLSGGCNKIFQICHCFRKSEVGRLHLEEFKMLEWYRTGADYYQLMEDCETLIQFLFTELKKLDIAGAIPHHPFFSEVRLWGKWDRMTVEEAFERYSPISLCQALADEKFDELLVEHIESNLGTHTPVFLYDYPVELGSLARKKESNPATVERFELYVNGVELANGFSELTDANEQRERFTAEIKAIAANAGTNVTMPEKFLEDLIHLNPAAGIALGVDRLFMIAMNQVEVSEVVTFSPNDL